MTGLKKRLSAILCATVLAVFGISSASIVYAGKSDVNVADNTSISGQIDEGKWRVSGGVYAAGGKIVFDENCKSDARVTARTFFKDCSYGGVTDVFSANYTLTINNIPEGENNRFSVASGLKKVADAVNSDGTTEVYFVNDGGTLKIGVMKNENGGKTDVVAPTADSTLAFGKQFKLGVSLVSDGYLTVTLSSPTAATKIICDDATSGNVGHSLSGLISIGQTAVCSAEVSSVKISAYDYDNAETPAVITEDFANNAYNGKLFYTRSDPNDMTTNEGGVRLENEALKFIGRPCFISTLDSYSNFELTFDITDVARKDVTDENGNVIAKKVSGWLGISLEADTAKGSFDNHARSNVLYTMQVVEKESKMYNRLFLTRFEQYPNAYKTNELDITSESNEGKVYNYKVVMQDGVFSIWYKLSDSADYLSQPLYTHDLGYTPFGSIAIMAYGDCGYTIDNLKIINNDYAPVIVERGYEAVKGRTEPDFVYEDVWSDDDVIANKIGKQKTVSTGCGANVAANAYAIIPMAICLLALAKRKKYHE